MALTRAGIKGWKLHPVGLLGSPDIYFPKERLAIFVDGCFWHGCARCGHIPKTRSAFWAAKIGRNKTRDCLNTRKLRQTGIDVIRIWEHALANPVGIHRILKAIGKALIGRKETQLRGTLA